MSTHHSDEPVGRVEYERMRRIADDQHAKFMVEAAKAEHLRKALQLIADCPDAAWASELRAIARSALSAT